VIAALDGVFDGWIVASLGGPRGASAAQLADLLQAHGQRVLQQCPDIAQAYSFACREAGEDDRICVFGSFHTVAEALLARGAKT